MRHKLQEHGSGLRWDDHGRCSDEWTKFALLSILYLNKLCSDQDLNAQRVQLPFTTIIMVGRVEVSDPKFQGRHAPPASRRVLEFDLIGSDLKVDGVSKWGGKVNCLNKVGSYI